MATVHISLNGKVTGKWVSQETCLFKKSFAGRLKNNATGP